MQFVISTWTYAIMVYTSHKIIKNRVFNPSKYNENIIVYCAHMVPSFKSMGFGI